MDEIKVRIIIDEITELKTEKEITKAVGEEGRRKDLERSIW